MLEGEEGEHRLVLELREMGDEVQVVDSPEEGEAAVGEAC